MNKIIKSISLIIAMSIILLFSQSFADNDRINKACSTDNNCNLIVGSDGKAEPYCYDNGGDFTSECVYPAIVNKLSKFSELSTVSAFVQNYCNTMLSSNQIQGRLYYAYPRNDSLGWDWQRTFDSNQSLFVYALCASFQNGSEYTFIPELYKNQKGTIASVFNDKISDILQLRQMSNGKDQCSLSSNASLSDCKMSIYATDIFSAVMSDIFKIRYAQVFQVDTYQKGSDNDQKRIENFMSGYFKMDDEYKKLNQQFPQTISLIKSNNKHYNAVLKSIQLLKNSDLSDIVSKGICNESGEVEGINFLACALHGGLGKDSSIDIPFETLYYNEVLNYRIFSSYYTNWLNYRLSKTSTEEETLDLSNEYDSMIMRVNRQLNAGKNTLQDLEDLSMTYPLHIGLLLYQEKVLSFRNKYLSKIVTSFYSLSEKLQNVQTKD